MAARSRDRFVDGVLISLGLLAIVDNVLFHWILGFHRFKTGWPGSIYVEVALVVLGAVMLWAGRPPKRAAAPRTRGGADG